MTTLEGALSSATIAHRVSWAPTFDQLVEQLSEQADDPDRASPEDLHPLDMWHPGGVEATDALAELAGVSSGTRALDVACGLGGTARRLAYRFGAQVDALEPSPQVLDIAIRLTALVDLSDRVTFQQGLAVEMPYGSSGYDLVLVQQFAMQVREKGRLWAECSRVLKPGGVLAVHDWFAGDAGEVSYPLPWADSEDQSSLETWDQLASRLTGRGLTVGDFVDQRESALEMFRQAREGLSESSGADPDRSQLVADAMISNLAEGRIVAGMAVCRRDGG